MAEQHATNILIEEATTAFASLSRPYTDIPFPLINGHADLLRIPAVWTLDGTHPRWDNLAVIAGAIDSSANRQLELWRSISAEFELPLTLLANNNQYVLLTRHDSGATTEETTDAPELRPALAAKREELFAPSRLAALRGGQLTFADLDTLSPKYTIQFRHRANLNKALEQALTGVFETQRQRVERTDNQDVAVIEVAIAYLSARVLADKGFFSPYPPSINDPRQLLQLTVEHMNGFFQRVCNQHLRILDDATLQQLATYLGGSVTFALIDDRDVGHLYEQSIILLNKRKRNTVLGSFEIAIPHLQQHYTPMAIAERMLAALPLERLRPEERVIFDPAAGSGTLLLAATKRLATMPDIPVFDTHHRREYLASHVIGNDIDPNAELITRLRYTLVQETLSETFPAPTHFSTEDYAQNSAWPTLPRPRVLVTNPPFEEQSGTQKAVAFLHNAMNRLQEGDQFAFILPQSFLTATKLGWKEARKRVAERSHIFETWQLPEGVIGLKAEQSTCIITGMIKTPKQHFTLARAIVSRSRKDLAYAQGFPGQAWISTIKAEQWQAVMAPVLVLTIPTVPLSQLFAISTGIDPEKGIKPIDHQPQNIKVKLFWRHRWRKPHSMLANSRYVKPEERYIRYGRPWLRYEPENEAVLDARKVLATRSVNRSSNEPFAAYFDTQGFAPTSDMFCIVPRSVIAAINERFDAASWEALTEDERMLWLLGILNADLATDLIMSQRDSRHVLKENLLNFPLPTNIDREIITIVDEIIQREQRDAPSEEIAPLRERLNNVVAASYGNPTIPLTLVRTGELPDMRKWQQERREKPLYVTGQVLDIDAENHQILLSLAGLIDDDSEAWVPLPPELPGWALEGTVFSADISETVETFAMLRERPWALRNIRHTPRPYMSLSELQEELFASLQDNM